MSSLTTPAFDRARHTRLMLFGIFIVLDICIFMVGLEEPPLPDMQKLQVFNGQVTYFFEGSAATGMTSRKPFLILKLDNYQHAFYLGLSDSLNDDDSTYLRVRNSIRLNDVIQIKGYFNQGKLGTDDYYNIVELKRDGKLLVTYKAMAAAIEAENQFNYMLFFSLNAILIFGFSYILMTGSDSSADQEGQGA